MEQERIAFNLGGLAAKLSCDFPISEGGSFRDLHFHGEAELVAVRSGEMLFCTQDSTAALREGDILYINGGCVHKLRPTPRGARCFLAQIDINRYIDLPSAAGCDYLAAFLSHRSQPPFCIFRSGEKPELAALTENVAREYKASEKFCRMFIKSYLYNIFAVLLRCGAIYDAEELCASEDLQRLAPALAYIERHSAERISLSDAAAVLNFDKAYFCRLFRSAVGSGFSDYLNFVRVSKAAKLLLEDSNVLMAALDAGFTTRQYFIRVFRRYCGCTPLQYRKQYLSGRG